jgi:hypothetical protein
MHSGFVLENGQRKVAYEEGPENKKGGQSTQGLRHKRKLIAQAKQAEIQGQITIDRNKEEMGGRETRVGKAESRRTRKARNP